MYAVRKVMMEGRMYFRMSRTSVQLMKEFYRDKEKSFDYRNEELIIIVA